MARELRRLPVPLEHRILKWACGLSPRTSRAIFGKPQPLAVPELARQRIGVVASGGSGATAAVVGVRRAFEDAGLEPAVIPAASGSVLFASLWACGLSAEEIGQFWLSLFTRDYVDPSWRAVARRALHRFHGTHGLVRGAAIERAFHHRIGDIRLGETRIPFAAAVHNLDAGRVELLSSRRTPDRAAVDMLDSSPARKPVSWYSRARLN